MPAIRTGRHFTCEFCKTVFYRRGSHIKRGITKSCGAPECKSKAMSGERNPYWGKGHSPEVLEKIAETKRARPRRYGPERGAFTHTPETKAAMSERMKERWASRRDEMIAKLPRGEDHHWRKSEHVARHRTNFTRLQKAEWLGPSCVWCDSPDDLVLDHIIPVVAGGKRERCNAQTLCRTCNLWKTTYMDRPYYLAMLGSQGGRN